MACFYPVLRRLERHGHIKASWVIAETGRRCKYYSITDAGHAHLADQRRQWQKVDATSKSIWSLLAPDPPIPQEA